MEKANQDIRNLMLKYGITANEILPFLDNFSHVTRIYEELAIPLSEERKQKYISAISKLRKEKIKELSE